MNIKIISDNKNPMFRRREIVARIGYSDVTPGRMEVRKSLASQLGAKEETVVIQRIKPDFGTPAAALEACVYDNEKALEEVESKYMVARNSPKQDDKKEGTDKPEQGAEKKEPAKEKEREDKKEADDKKSEPAKEEAKAESDEKGGDKKE